MIHPQEAWLCAAEFLLHNKGQLGLISHKHNNIKEKGTQQIDFNN